MTRYLTIGELKEFVLSLSEYDEIFVPVAIFDNNFISVEKEELINTLSEMIDEDESDDQKSPAAFNWTPEGRTLWLNTWVAEEPSR